MEPVRLLATLFPLALASGVNLYATILVTGFSIKMGWIQKVPAGLEVFASTPILVITAIFYLLEFFADKIQIVDTVWDTIHTIIRPLGISFLTLAALYEYNPMIGIIAALSAGSVSFISHTAKAGTRFSLNVLSPVENVKNIGISVTEDLLVGGFSFLALKYPYLTATVALVLFILILIFLPLLFRWLFFTISALFFRFASLVKKREENEIPKGEYLALLEHPKIIVSLKCKPKGVPSAKGRIGYLLLLEDKICFVYSRFFGLIKRVWSLSTEEINAVYFRKRPLVDILEIHYLNSKGKPKISRFIALKNRSLLLQKIESAFKK